MGNIILVSLIPVLLFLNVQQVRPVIGEGNADAVYGNFPQGPQVADTIGIQKRLSAMRSFNDIEKKVVWYYDPASITYINVSTIYLYIGVMKRGNVLRMRIQHNGNDQVHTKNITLLTGTHEYKMDLTRNPLKVDSDDTGFWEWFDMPLTPADYPMLTRLISSPSSRIRFEGEALSSFRMISEEEKEAMGRVMEVFGGMR